MNKKKLNAPAVINELTGQSAYFSKSAPSTPKPNKSKKGNEKNIDSNTASNIAILHFDEADIDNLREAAYKPQTYRLSDREVEWVKDTAFKLSKEIKRGRVSQVDILRIGLKLFDNALSINKAEILEIIQSMK